MNKQTQKDQFLNQIQSYVLSFNGFNQTPKKRHITMNIQEEDISLKVLIESSKQQFPLQKRQQQKQKQIESNRIKHLQQQSSNQEQEIDENQMIDENQITVQPRIQDDYGHFNNDMRITILNNKLSIMMKNLFNR